MASKKGNTANFEPSLGQIFYHNMKKYGEKILQYIADTDETDTYQQVLTRSIRTALKMKERGIQKGDIISICSYNHKDTCVPLVAAFFIGAIPANFDPNLSYLDTLNLLKVVHPKMVFVSEESLPTMEKCIAEVKADTQFVVFGEGGKYSSFSEFVKPHTQENSFQPIEIDSRETAAILFSSGTTGLPKGICISHRSLIMHINNNDLFISMADVQDPVSLVYSTFYWISGILFFTETLVIGGARVVCFGFDPEQTWRVIEKYKVNSLFVTPNAANEIVIHRLKTADTSSLRVLTTGAFPVSKRLMEDLRVAFPNTAILHIYGQTEATSIVSKFDPLKPEDVEMQNNKPLSCGRILSSYAWKVVDPTTNKKLGPNQRGELRLKSEFLMNEYYKMDSSSAYDSEGYLRTGDIVYYDEDGCLFIVDRLKEMFKYKGWQILPAVLEDVLVSHPGVKEAVVISVPHEIDGEHPMGVVVLYDGYKHVSPKEIEEFVKDKVSDFQRLRGGVCIVESIQRTATGKIRRNDLKNTILEKKEWIASSC